MALSAISLTAVQIWAALRDLTEKLEIRFFHCDRTPAPWRSQILPVRKFVNGVAGSYHEHVSGAVPAQSSVHHALVRRRVSLSNLILPQLSNPGNFRCSVVDAAVSIKTRTHCGRSRHVRCVLVSNLALYPAMQVVCGILLEQHFVSSWSSCVAIVSRMWHRAW